MAESYSDMSLEPELYSADLSRPRTPAAPALQIVDRDTGLRGRPKTAAERIKHHLSVYELVTASLHPADIKQLIELTHAILQDAQDVVSEAQQIRAGMLANILGVSPKSISSDQLERLINGLARHTAESPAPAA